MVLDTFKEFIELGIENNEFIETCQLLRSLAFIKEITLIDDKNANLSRAERKRLTGFTIPHTANYHYIMKHIKSDMLYEIISSALVKVEKSNLHLKNEVALRKKDTNIKNGRVLQEERIQKISELNLNHDLFVKLLYEINHVSEEQFELIENFLDSGVYDLCDEYENNKRKELEKKRMTLFKGDIPISVNNSIIFNKTFIVEQWIRRIIMFVLMTEYGSDWIKAFNDKDLEEYETMRRKLTGRETIDHKDDHLLWYASIVYLARFIKKNNIVKNNIEIITNMQAQTISKAVFKIADIRNEMAHNRTITKLMEEDYKTNFDILKNAIMNFKSRTIYSKGEIISGFLTDYYDSDFLAYFKKLDKEHFNANGTQSFIEKGKNHYALVLLPCEPIGAEYIDIGVLLDRYAIYKDYIVAFYVNKVVEEYQAIISKEIEGKTKIYKSIIDIFFDLVKSIGTNVPYELQDAKYTCNPKIWFYENNYEVGLELW